MTHSLESQKKHQAQCEEMALRAIRAIDSAVSRQQDHYEAVVSVPAGWLLRLLNKHITITIDTTKGTANAVISGDDHE